MILLIICPPYLQATTSEQISPPEHDEYKTEQKAAIASERAEYEALKVMNFYEYTEEEAEEIANQLIRACPLLIVIAKCLPGFEHNMLKADKEAFVQMIYRLPNRIFGMWSTLTDKNIAELIDFFQSQGQDYYHRRVPATRDDILHALQYASISMLLDMYNMAAYHSAKENTQSYLGSEFYKNKTSYRLEHIMILERGKHVNSFTDEVMELANEDIPNMLMNCLGYVVRHALVYVPDFKPAQIDRMGNKFFAKRDSRARLMAQRHLGSGAKKQD